MILLKELKRTDFSLFMSVLHSKLTDLLLGVLIMLSRPVSVYCSDATMLLCTKDVGRGFMKSYDQQNSLFLDER